MTKAQILKALRGAAEPTLKKLRNRLLVVNLVSLTFVVAIAFSIIYINFYNSTQNEIEETLSSIPPGVLENAMLIRQSESISISAGSSASESQITISGEPRLPVDYSKSFVANIMNDGSIAVFSMLDMDNETYLAAIETVFANKTSSGALRIADRAWRYKLEAGAGAFTPYQYAIVFLDVEDTNRGLGTLAASLFVIGIISVGAILLVSLLIANRAILPVEESIVRQRRFVADASHELKTPIAIITANAEAAASAALETPGSESRSKDAGKYQGEPGDGFKGSVDLPREIPTEPGHLPTEPGHFTAGVSDPPAETPKERGRLSTGANNPPTEPGGISKWIGNIADEANRMNGLVENLLMLARAEERDADCAVFDLVAAVCEETDRVEAFLFENDIEFVFERPQQGKVNIRSDSAKVKAALSVLLENAVKYTPKGGHVSVSVGKNTKSNSVYVAVSNTGPYIPPEDISLIFERFYRSDPSRNSETGGHGIGLSIASGIARSLGGELTAASAPLTEGGAVNTFTLILS